ncbi:MAG: transposase [Flavobacterium sp.]
MTLDQDEFIRCFLQHDLPLRFSKIRYYGFMSQRNLQLSAYEVFRRLTNKDPHICSTCKKGSFIEIPVKTRDPD